MVTKITIKDPTKTPIAYWQTVPWLKSLNDLDFSPGLNVLVGPNGSGKSTLLKAIATATHCIQSGVSHITNTSCREMCPYGELKNGIQIESNGKPFGFFTPEQRPGLVGGMAGFDDDFLSEGLSSTMFKGSSGEETIVFLGKLLDKLTATTTIPYKTTDVHNTDYVFKNTVDCGTRPTLLLDEPERAVSILTQIKLWTAIERLSWTRFQVIVASHSLLGLCKAANYIETEKDFYSRTKTAVLAEIENITKNLC